MEIMWTTLDPDACWPYMQYLQPDLAVAVQSWTCVYPDMC